MQNKKDILIISAFIIIFLSFVVYIYFKESIFTLVLSGCVLQMLTGIFSIYETDKENKYKRINNFTIVSIFVILIISIRFCTYH